MGGAAAVFGAMLALAGRKARANVVGVVGLVENMPSANAQRPGDVVRSMAGKTIEVDQHRRRGPARAVRRAPLHARAVQAQGDDRPRHAHRRGHRGAGPRAGRPVQQRRDAGRRSDSPPPASTRRAALAAAAGQGLREAHQVRHRRHQECRAAAARPAARPVPCSCSSSSATRPGRISTSPPWPGASRDLPLSGKGATGFGVRLLDRLVADRYEATA